MTGKVMACPTYVYSVWTAVARNGVSASDLTWRRVCLLDDKDVALDEMRRSYDQDKSHAYIVVEHADYANMVQAGWLGLDDTIQPNCAYTGLCYQLGHRGAWQLLRDVADFALKCNLDDTFELTND